MELAAARSGTGLKASVKSRAAPPKKRNTEDGDSAADSAAKKIQKIVGLPGSNGEKHNKVANPVPEKTKTPRTPKTPVDVPQEKPKKQKGSTEKHLAPPKVPNSVVSAPASGSQPHKRLRRKSSTEVQPDQPQPSEIETLSKVCGCMVSAFFWDSGLLVLFP